MESVIIVEKLSKSYGSCVAVDTISFAVQRGTVFGLLGANGAGKSSMIECITGTKKPDDGSVSILGMDPVRSRKQLFERVGVQFQETGYQEQIKVNELCEEISSLYQEPADYHDLLSKFGIADKGSSFVKELSGGQRQRLFIVLALIPEPEVVFLDELTTGLDARARRAVWKILAKLKSKGLTIFLTSHFMDEVEVLCDRICILKSGKSVFEGTVAEAIEGSPYEKLEDAYLWYTGEEKDEDEDVSDHA